METKAIFVTGGSGGMGLETGRRFLEAGWRVGLFDVSAAGLRDAEASLNSDRLMTQVLDVTQPEDFAAGVAAFGEFSGQRMDILFNNAGIAPGGIQLQNLHLKQMENQLQ